MKKITARAHSNIAFVKYWGKKDEVLRLPTNASVSMNLSELYTTTTVEFQSDLKADSIIIGGILDTQMTDRVTQHLDRIRTIAGVNMRAKVVSQNNFPTSAGLSSSAAGFAALTIAATGALELSLSEHELSILARQGSGSACRSIPDGFVEWKDASTSEESYAYSLFPPAHWDIVDVIALTSAEKKSTPTTQGQKLTTTSVFFEERLRHIQNKVELCKRLLRDRDFSTFGKLVEMEALEMHAVMITSWPPLLYWLPETVKVMHAIQEWRRNGLEVYFTINTGQNVHILCRHRDVSQVELLLRNLPYVQKIIKNTASRGTYVQETHLF